MAQEIFERYEKKYMLNPGQRERLLAAAGSRMRLDGYGRHTICNLYFDTPDYQLIRASLQKPVYKEKLRLRGYGTGHSGDDPVYLELKKKYRSVVYKRRTEMSLKEAEAYMEEGREPERTGQIFREADYTKRRYGLRPLVYISYEREAYTCGEEGLRMTFDQNILARHRALRLDGTPWGTALLEPGQTLMELKIPGAMPVWMSRLLAGLAAYPVSFSKYGTYYQQYIYPELSAGNWRQGGEYCA